MASLLIADDEKNILSGLQLAFEDEGYEVIPAANGREAWEKLQKNIVDLVITDLRMPEMDGYELLKRIAAAYPTLPVIVLTGHGTIETAVETMRDGAVDFFTKPVDIDKLILVVKKTVAASSLAEQNRKLSDGYSRIIGRSEKVSRMMQTISQVADTRATVLVTGESGTGKELVADALVALSSRSDRTFVKVHAAALSASLLEDELFGHEKGAFTGAVSMKKGRFELADGGTIFLDEIGEIDPSTQVKLLRVLQEREFERVGGEKPISVDVRVICATNRDLAKEVKEGRFREDLYYRLNVVRIEVPPLRERKEDIDLLAASFLETFNKEDKRKIEGFTPAARKALFAYSWPGNIRELKNAVESAVVLARGSMIDKDDLPEQIRETGSGSRISFDLPITLYEAEKRLILETISYAKGNKTKAAELLGIGRKTITRRMQDLRIDGEEK